ncbi:MAG: hypothetical protein ABIK43_02180 [candidate division WOR-3 bacterium]
MDAPSRLVTAVKRQQREWLGHWHKQHGRQAIWQPDNPGRLVDPALNLFEPMSPSTRLEYWNGDGDELGRREPLNGKILSPHSSAALCCNLFHYWRERHLLGEIARAVGIGDSGIDGLRFEMRLRIPGIRGTPPNLDAILTYGDGRLVGFECKFTEGYAKKTEMLSTQYTRATELWRGMSHLHELAKRVCRAPYAGYAGVPQLITRLLAMNAFAKPRRFTLVYLWFDLGGSVAAEHRKEVEWFREELDRDKIDFIDITYQKVLRRLRDYCATSHTEYVTYMTSRYLGD